MSVSDSGPERESGAVVSFTERRAAAGQASRSWFDRPAAFVVALVLALGVLLCSGWTNYNSVKALTAVTASKGSLPPVDPGSPTGYADGMRRVIMPRGVDGCYWIMNAQRMAHEGKWRVRQMPDDNLPSGREMHWSHLFLWRLILLGWISTTFTGLPIGAVIENAAVWAALPIHALVIIGLPLAVRKSFGWSAAALLALAMATVYTFASYFLVGSPDHHGPAAIIGSGTRVFLVGDPFLWALHGNHIHEFKPLLL